MVTGGIRRLSVVNQVLDCGIAMAGIGTALAIDAQLVKHWREGSDNHPQLPPIRWKRKPLAALASMAVVSPLVHSSVCRRCSNTSFWSSSITVSSRKIRLSPFFSCAYLRQTGQPFEPQKHQFLLLAAACLAVFFAARKRRHGDVRQAKQNREIC